MNVGDTVKSNLGSSLKWATDKPWHGVVVLVIIGLFIVAEAVMQIAGYDRLRAVVGVLVIVLSVVALTRDY